MTATCVKLHGFEGLYILKMGRGGEVIGNGFVYHNQQQMAQRHPSQEKSQILRKPQSTQRPKKQDGIDLDAVGKFGPPNQGRPAFGMD